MEQFAPWALSAFFGFALLSSLAAMYRTAFRHGFKPVLAAPFSGAFLGFFAWLLIDGSSQVLGAGVPERSERWILSNVYFSIASVAGLATAAALAGYASFCIRRRSIATEAKDAGLAYQESVPREEVAIYGLKAFANFSRGSDAVRGYVAGVPFLVFDLKARELRGSDGKQESIERFRTVVTMPVPRSESWARFQVVPAGYRIAPLTMPASLRLSLPEDRQALPEERTLLARWDERYVLEGLLADADRIAKHFGWRAVRFFASEPGWAVECSGTHLVFWRGERILNARDRKSLTAAAAQLLDALRPVDEPPLLVVSGFQPKEVAELGLKAVAAGCVIFAAGAIAMFATFLAFVAALALADEERSSIIGFAWPPAGLAAFIGGAYGAWQLVKRLTGGR